ncbi:hypothetical protein NNC19_22490 [Clostridium sp. SHJSY1]|uniref:hypothetical protein n=1 Tax=Clostridium sp. SHJSY1 TaxID=2942483 RepID=UPI0028750F81|nr:hypothetical protein [Clostridium sp. SHJSY1]MDS0528462.1 hypothetical protein [Clostridium sp. SHJSY1]
MIGAGLTKILAGITIAGMIAGAGISFNKVVNTKKIDTAVETVQKAQQQINETSKQYDSDKGEVQKLIDYVKNLEKQVDDTNKKLDMLDQESTKLNAMLK